ncbi:MAG TPA: hypothetical protein VM285_16315 [Polyangia bacterium]|nr:hypothetical protein [Polyangia bacterium]
MIDNSRRAVELAPRRMLFRGGDLLTLVVAEPLPPGSRIAVRLAGGETGDPAVTGKIVALRRGPDGEVELDIRLRSLSREQRSRLAALVNPSA